MSGRGAAAGTFVRTLIGGCCSHERSKKGLAQSARDQNLLDITVDATRLDRAKKFVIDGLASGKLKPVIARMFPFNEIIEAHRYLESNQQIGKIVVTV